MEDSAGAISREVPGAKGGVAGEGRLVGGLFGSSVGNTRRRAVAMVAGRVTRPIKIGVEEAREGLGGEDGIGGFGHVFGSITMGDEVGEIVHVQGGGDLLDERANPDGGVAGVLVEIEGEGGFARVRVRGEISEVRPGDGREVARAFGDEDDEVGGFDEGIARFVEFRVMQPVEPGKNGEDGDVVAAGVGEGITEVQGTDESGVILAQHEYPADGR